MSLREYQKKRDFQSTPEPRGRVAKRKGYSFVIQKHQATRLHYDFRLELDGVLLSWAVPKGPSLDPAEKRLAVQVEDHPLDYGGFEGVIPSGYGAGTVMLWDRGHWTPRGDARHDYQAGRLKFTLDGEKLRGGWTLVRMGHRNGSSSSKPNWLLIKERDDTARPETEGSVTEELPLSVKSGRDLDEITAGRLATRKRAVKQRAKAIAKKAKRKPRAKAAPRRRAAVPKDRKLAELPGARAAAMPKELAAQLCTLVSKPPEGDEWLHELKFDGYRMFCRLEQGKVRFISRNAQDWTVRMSALQKTAALLPAREAVLDGEVVVLDADGVSSFQALQNAFRRGGDAPLIYYAFDLLYLDGYDLRDVPLIERKNVLESLLRALPAGATSFRYSEHIVGSGEEFQRQVCVAGLEGGISKRQDAPYVGGRSASWLKYKCRQGQELVIGGFTKPAGSRTGFGALLVGYYRPDGQLVYGGRVGTGFDDRTLGELHARLKNIEQNRSPFADFPRRGAARDLHWVRPELVAQVEFANWTDEGLLRQASFLGLRQDKPPRKVVRESPTSNGQRADQLSQESPMPTRTSRKAAAEVVLPDVRLTNPDRVLWADQGLTKHDLATYYAQVAEWMLPHVAGRPLALVRCPDGVGKACFFQKHPPTGMSAVVRRIKVREKEGMELYLVVDNLEGLVSLVQFGALEIHVWGSREDNIERPDRLVFDLDPDPAVAWPRVVEGAMLLRDLLKELGLVSFVKTTGGKGLHLVVPVERRHEWPEAKQFCRRVAELMVSVAPNRYLAKMSKAARRGKIFVDYLRNDRGSTAIAAYSTRARPGATVSVPLAWQELSKLAGPAEYTVTNLPQRLANLRRDPWDELPQVRQSIAAASKKLP